ncbi:hypothetical protein LB467_13890 [Salegentibacter sp. JZCK2]|uniref:hypothetical protein n=1 Tax=Salegentibacter tibetensis TaxID=2873600 RepID=UPI001CCCD3D7|nr:hypothetical protein [Salegentibacter tibetensis]MBZ9730782.1 hypothetical protein [Salegentibacter tibetensis]
MERPILLLKKELINPIEQALDRIEKIRQRKMNNEDSIILEGLFALGVASFEHSIIDTLRILLNYIPDKLDVKSENISKQHLIDGNPLEKAIENKVNSVSCKNLPDIIRYFTTISGIPENIVTEDELAELIEIKATRNLLIHNNLMVNSFYRETSGTKVREGQGSKNRLVINQDYLFESLVIMRSVLGKFKHELNLKYNDFTKIKAMKSLFSYIFQTPVMKFENEFEVDEDRDVIINLKPETSMKGRLSSSETLFYNIWVAHSHGNKFEFDRGYFYGLDNRNRKKMAFLIEKLDILKP